MSRTRSTAAVKLTATAPVFAALGDATRLALVGRLCADGPLSIARLSDGAGVTRQAVTKHLHVLADAGLAIDYWVGRDRVWELETESLRAARESLERISAQWDATLGRLKAFVETSP
jgi:DNA-binding transcriptional ArsR family regulator